MDKINQKSGRENEQPVAHNPPPTQGAQNEPAGEAQKTPGPENKPEADNSDSDKTLGVKPIQG
jgi:hypothetical protein